MVNSNIIQHMHIFYNNLSILVQVVFQYLLLLQFLLKSNSFLFHILH